MTAPVLLTWLATRNDPYERVKSGGPFRETPDGPVPGPTLTLLTDPASPYAKRITDVVVLRQAGSRANDLRHVPGTSPPGAPSFHVDATPAQHVRRAAGGLATRRSPPRRVRAGRAGP